MRRTILKTESFVADLERSFEYGISFFGLSVATQFRDRVDETIDMIAEYPNIGTDLSEFAPLLRQFILSPYRVVYTIEAESVTFRRFIRTEQSVSSEDML